MKKIFLLISITVLTLSCSKNSNEEATINNTPKELIGTWKYTGYYDDEEINGSNYHLTNESFNITFNLNGTFETNYNNVVSYGNYSIDQNSVLVCSTNTAITLPFPMNSFKIFSITNNIFRGFSSDSPIDYQFEKVNSTPTISGKK